MSLSENEFRYLIFVPLFQICESRTRNFQEPPLSEILRRPVPSGILDGALQAFGASRRRHLPVALPAIRETTEGRVDTDARVLLGVHPQTHRAHHEEDRQDCGERREFQTQVRIQQIHGHIAGQSVHPAAAEKRRHLRTGTRSGLGISLLV